MVPLPIFLLCAVTVNFVHCSLLGSNSIVDTVLDLLLPPSDQSTTTTAPPAADGFVYLPGCGAPPPACDPAAPFRSYNGVCNNIKNPSMGSSYTPFKRTMSANYADGISALPVTSSGQTLPLARTLSLALYPDKYILDPKWSLATMQYGQIVTHDMSMAAGGIQNQYVEAVERCCTEDGSRPLHPAPARCYPILLPDGDPLRVGNKSGVRCINFMRTTTTHDRKCTTRDVPAEQISTVNNWLDLSLVYGNEAATAWQLRAHNGGRMRTEQRRAQEWPPRALDPSTLCPAQRSSEPCYFAGDTRINENPQLTALQVVYLREHNRLANALASLNPHWDDERLYQEARRLNIAQHQVVTYNEWLPIVLGAQHVRDAGITYDAAVHDCVDDYNEKIDGSAGNEYSGAAFRTFHSSIEGYLSLMTEDRQKEGALHLSDYFMRPAVIEQGDTLAKLCRGMTAQPEQANDAWHVVEITQQFIRGNNPVCRDLKAIDIQRARDFACCTYNDARERCGLQRAVDFDDFIEIAPENREKLRELYACVDDVELSVGGSLETHVPGQGLAGPTFICIIIEQFQRTRRADRFFFERCPNNYSNAFTIPQLRQLRQVTISRLMCDNVMNVTHMQPRGFEIISLNNTIVPCNELPRVDLSYWKE